MYLDVVLFVIGIVCVIILLIMVGYLIISNRRSRLYRKVLQQETEFFDALSTTVSKNDKLTHSQTMGEFTETEYVDLSTEFMADDNAYSLTNPVDEDATEAVFHPESNNQKTAKSKTAFDISVLAGNYTIDKEIHGGGMSRVFLATHNKLGNKWIIKFISHGNGQLANEAEILKKLNHMSLPRIIDIYQDDKGIYIVESYIEGVSLDKVLASAQKISETVISDWATQLAQVLSYLHSMEPYPIHHLDMKPSNIMVTHDNRLVLVDFGISKHAGLDSDELQAVTYAYAAPEQLKNNIPAKYTELIKARFGELPPERINWQPNHKTDIYGLGLIIMEAVIGQPSSEKGKVLLNDIIYSELSKIIQKCIEIDPDKRYQSAVELIKDIQKTKGTRVKMARTLFMRKLAVTTSAFSVFVSGGSFFGAAYVFEQERLSALIIKPEAVTVSLQQTTELTIEKRTPSGKIVIMDADEITWDFSPNRIARVDGNRIVGMNTGETELIGKYRDKTIELNINVVNPMDGMVDISQRYELGHTVQLLTGGKEREILDGSLEKATFTSPEGIAIAENGTIYISDAGVLRKISGNTVETIETEPFYMTAKILRCFGNDLYILTHEWQDSEDNKYYYGIMKLSGSRYEELYITDAGYSAIEDFAFDGEGLLHFIERNAGAGAVYLKTLNTKNPDDIFALTELPEGTNSLTIDPQKTIYLANSQTGALQIYSNGELTYFAGVENEKSFIDGAVPRFYEPQRIKYSGGYLYIWDFNVLRRVEVNNNLAGETITLAGEATPEFDLKIEETSYAAESIVLPNSKLMDFEVDEGRVILIEPKRGAVWVVE